VQNLKEIFDLFDKEKNQTINVKDLETIMGSLQRDPAEVREFIDDLGQEISFDQFIDLMQKIENRIVHNQENEQLENQ
jgi:Ca2+-binding EF-hand superfamily protein